MHHGHGQRQALAHAQRQAFGQRVQHLLQLKTLHHGLHACGLLVGGHMEQLRVQHQVLPHGELAIQRERLRHIAHAPARVDVVRIDRLAEQPGLAVARRQQAGEHLHGRRFAAAVGAQEAEDLAPADAEVDVIDGGEVAKAHGQALGLDGHIRVVHLQRRNHHRLVAALFFLGHEGDEDVL